MEFVCKGEKGDTYRFVFNGGKLKVSQNNSAMVQISGFVAKTVSGSRYQFSIKDKELRVLRNFRKEVQITSIKVEGNRLNIMGYDFDFYGNKNDTEYMLCSTPVSTITIIH